MKQYSKWLILVLILLALALVPQFVSSFRLNLVGKFLTFAIVAVGLDLIWGYTGILSLGHGVFFGLGAYCMGMYLKLEASGNSLPDFMSWSGLFDLPGFWKPFVSPWFTIGAVLIIPMAMAAFIGYLAFRSRVKGSYFAIITQALALIFTTLFIGQQPYTGGTNGITNLSTILGYSLADTGTQTALYYITLGTLGLILLASKLLVDSRLGNLLIAIRDGENRTRFIGYNPVFIKTIIFAVSGLFAGLAGALFIPQVGIISPSMMGIVPSIEMAIWVAVGGRGTIYGAVLGALVVNLAKSLLSETYPDIWLYLLGALFIGAVVFFPDGIMGIIKRFQKPIFHFKNDRTKEKEG
jgi:urea transport system permease protein